MSCVKMTSVVAQFDNLVRALQVSAEVSVEQKFIEYIDETEKVIRQMNIMREEAIKSQEQLQKSRAEAHALEMKLRNARHMLDLEKSKRISIEKERNDLMQQIGMVVDLFGRGMVNETREKLQFLSSSFGEKRRAMSTASMASPEKLSTIDEDNDDTLGSVLSVSDIDLTEDDLDQDCSRLRSGRAFKRNLDTSEPSSHSADNEAAHGGRKRHSGGKSSKKDLGEHAFVMPTAPPLSDMADFLPKVSCRRAAPLPPSLPDTPHALPTQVFMTPTAPHLSSPMRTFSGSKMTGRLHAFYTKTIYKAENCGPCGKRVKFGKMALKCRDCRATCHPECRDAVPLPCVPTATTPNPKGYMGCIADFAPTRAPMVPALIVHCTNEIENRGLNEVGLYRLSGMDRDVKELKDRFLRGKSTNLSQVTDIHVLCGTVKDFLRSLKDPLVTQSLWHQFVAAAEKCDAQDAVSSLYQAVSELPQPNRDSLAWMIVHLQRVAECPDCKMPASNLAKVFGPTLIGYSTSEPDASTMLSETRKQQLVMEKLLDLSSDYWNSFLKVEENLTPDMGGGFPPPMLGSLTSGRRKSFLSYSPLGSRPFKMKN